MAGGGVAHRTRNRNWLMTLFSFGVEFIKKLVFGHFSAETTACDNAAFITQSVVEFDAGIFNRFTRRNNPVMRKRVEPNQSLVVKML